MPLVSKPHPRAAFAHRDFRFYLAARFLSLVSHQMFAVAIGQYVYELTRNPIYLGYIGLAFFAPKVGFTLLAGHIADRFDRRWVVFLSILTSFIAATTLIISLHLDFNALWLIYALLFVMGTGNAFGGPASQALVTQLVPPEDFSNAVMWNSSFFQIAFIVGPALSGFLYAGAGHALAVFYVVALLRLLSVVLLLPIRSRTEHREKAQLSWSTVLAGLRYIFEKKIIFGIISLDLFAVLLGGAVALMPIFANDILKVGPSGLGILRAAPAVGAALVAIALAYLPPMKRAGATMLACVAIFGLATVGFGLSHNFALSLACLFVLGAADMVSVVIRGVLVQIKTPPAMRGRVSAVNLIFIGASNELGEFESGLTAAWFGAVPAVILGGLGTLTVVALWTWKFPEIRNYGELHEPAV